MRSAVRSDGSDVRGEILIIAVLSCYRIPQGHRTKGWDAERPDVQTVFKDETRAQQAVQSVLGWGGVLIAQHGGIDGFHGLECPYWPPL